MITVNGEKRTLENPVTVTEYLKACNDNKYANSAILVNVTPDDFGSSHPLAGMYFQRKLEEKAKTGIFGKEGV